MKRNDLIKNIRIIFATIAMLVLLLPNSLFAQGILQLHEPGEKISADAARITIEIAPVPIPLPPDHRRILPPPPPRPWPAPVPYQAADLTSLEVDVQIDGMTATTAIDQTFRNPFSRRLEGTYLFPLPTNAVLRDLSLYIDGKPVKCEVVEADKARAIYEDIVRRARDPALLEYVGRDLVRLRIFPIEAGQTRRVKFQYSQVLKRDFGLTEYAYPLLTRDQAMQHIGSFAIKGTIHSDKPITTINSPTHDIEFKRKDDKTATFGFEKENFQAAANLKIFFGVSEKEMGASVVVYRVKGEDGYYMLMIAPRAASDKEKRKAIPKDVTFVFDTSGSMAGDNIEQARRALAFCLNSLREQDRFNIIRFSTETEPFAKELVPATKGKIKEAQEFVKGIEARGGTAINDALMQALDSKGSKERPHLIVFMTDGKPTVGECGTDAILKNIVSKNENKARVFVFGVGNTVNTQLLDKMSDENGGVTDYIGPKEDIEVKVSNFFSKVSDPILTGLELDYGAIKPSKSYPKSLPDLFAGGQVTILGRYQGAGKADIVLKGSQAGEKKVFEYALEFPEEASNADFLPRLWAIRRVGHLVDEIRKNGESKELKDEVVALGKKYAIATPYTSMLVLEDGAAPALAAARPGETIVTYHGTKATGAAEGKAAFFYDPIGGPVSNGEIARRTPGVSGGSMPSDNKREAPAASRSRLSVGDKDRSTAYLSPYYSGDTRTKDPSDFAPFPAAMKAESGADAVAMARITREMKETESLSKSGSKEQADAQQVAGRTFYLKDGVWTDSEYDGKAEAVKIASMSDEYFALLKKGGDIGRFLSVGTKVIFRFEGKWYQITDAVK
ncbi:MAG: VIT domain-containing protein [Candidatus Sumerlaeota bacterium]|nr:VIT domain-containing protein [Candidatus Sumerlaeota bacterium]